MSSNDKPPRDDDNAQLDPEMRKHFQRIEDNQAKEAARAAADYKSSFRDPSEATASGIRRRHVEAMQERITEQREAMRKGASLDKYLLREFTDQQLDKILVFLSSFHY